MFHIPCALSQVRVLPSNLFLLLFIHSASAAKDPIKKCSYTQALLQLQKPNQLPCFMNSLSSDCTILDFLTYITFIDPNLLLCDSEKNWLA